MIKDFFQNFKIKRKCEKFLKLAEKIEEKKGDKIIKKKSINGITILTKLENNQAKKKVINKANYKIKRIQRYET